MVSVLFDPRLREFRDKSLRYAEERPLHGLPVKDLSLGIALPEVLGSWPPSRGAHSSMGNLFSILAPIDRIVARFGHIDRCAHGWPILVRASSPRIRRSRGPLTARLPAAASLGCRGRSWRVL